MLTGQNHQTDKTRQRPHGSAQSGFPQNGRHHEVQDAGDVHGDGLLRGLPLRLDPGVFHSAHRVLDLLRGGEHRADHLQLLLQPVEDLHLRHHGGVGLQGLPLHAGSAW